MSSPQEHLAALDPARDRRLHTRTTPSSPAHVTFGNASRGAVLNISETGMAVAAPDLPVAGDYLPRICLQLPGSTQAVEMSAQVVWQAESKKGAGIRFVVLSPDARSQISNWIASENPIPDCEQLPKLPLRDEQLSGFSARKSGKIFSHPPVLDEEASARYAEMFPSEAANAKRINKINESEAQPEPPPISEGSLEGAVDSNPNRNEASPSPFHILELSAFQVAALVFLFAVIGLAVGLAAITTSFDAWTSAGRGSLAKHARNAQTSSPSSGSVETTSQTTTPPAADAFNTPALIPPSPKPEESRPESPSARSLSAQIPDSSTRVSPSAASPTTTSPSRIDSDNASRANKLHGAAPLEKKSKENSWDSNFFAKSAATNSSPAIVPKPSAKPEASPERHGATGLVARNAPPPATPKSAHSPAAVSPTNSKSVAKPPATNSNSSPKTESKPAAKPAASPERHAAAAPVARNAPPPANPKPAHTSKTVGRTIAGPKNHAPNTPAPPTAAPVKAVPPKPTPPPASPEPAHASKTVGPTIAAPKNPAPPTAAPAKAVTPKPTPPSPAKPDPALSAKVVGPTIAAPKNPAPPPAAPATAVTPKPSPPPANSEPAHAAAAPAPTIAAPKNPAPPSAAPATAAAPNSSTPSANLFTTPAENSKPLKMVFPQKRIAASSSLEITTQLSVLVPPEPGAVATPPRLQAGKLVSYVLPRSPRSGDRYGAEETVKLHATIGQLGQVTDIKPVSGPIFLLSSATSAVRLWRYKPTLLNGRPVEAQQDVTITFQLPR